MKKKKINRINVFKALILLISLIVVMHDCYLVIFGSYQWTWYGVATFMICAYIFIDILDDFIEQTKKMPNDCDKRHQDK